MDIIFVANIVANEVRVRATTRIMPAQVNMCARVVRLLITILVLHDSLIVGIVADITLSVSVGNKITDIVNVNDNVTITCTISNKKPNTERKWILEIKEQADQFSLSNFESVFQELHGDKYTVSGFTDQYFLTCVGSCVYTLGVKQIQLQDDGSYGCQFSNTDTKNSRVIVQDAPDETYFKINGRRYEDGDVYEIPENGNVTIECFATNSNPPAELSWKLNTKPIGTDQYKNSVENGTVKYTETAISSHTFSATKVEEGKPNSLVCGIKHSAYSIGSKNLALNLDVTYPPAAVTSFKIEGLSIQDINGKPGYKVKVDEKVTFSCQIQGKYPGNPQPTLTLIYKNEEDGNYKEVDASHVESNFNDKKVTFTVGSYKYSGLYRCRAKNKINFTESSEDRAIRLEVTGERPQTAGLQPGAIAGIVFGVIVFVALAILFVWYFKIRKGGDTSSSKGTRASKTDVPMEIRNDADKKMEEGKHFENNPTYDDIDTNDNKAEPRKRTSKDITYAELDLPQTNPTAGLPPPDDSHVYAAVNKPKNKRDGDQTPPQEGVVYAQIKAPSKTEGGSPGLSSTRV